MAAVADRAKGEKIVALPTYFIFVIMHFLIRHQKTPELFAILALIYRQTKNYEKRGD